MNASCHRGFKKSCINNINENLGNGWPSIDCEPQVTELIVPILENRWQSLVPKGMPSSEELREPDGGASESGDNEDDHNPDQQPIQRFASGVPAAATRGFAVRQDEVEFLDVL